MIIEVARLGQRLVRDDRITTHAALVSRAFGARRIYMSEASGKIKDAINGINHTWGGSFEVVLEDDMRGVIRRKKSDLYRIVHLSMYGQSLNQCIQDMYCMERILVVVGAGKVPREIYQMADYNISVGNQPHSEIAALAVLLDRIHQGRQLDSHMRGGTHRIVPCARGKKVITN